MVLAGHQCTKGSARFKALGTGRAYAAFVCHDPVAFRPGWEESTHVRMSRKWKLRENNVGEPPAEVKVPIATEMLVVSVLAVVVGAR